MSELFASMHFQMAKEFVKTYKPEKSEEVSPEVSPVKKKGRAPAKKKSEKPEKPEKVLCKGVTAKGKPCKNGAIEGDFCRVHAKNKDKEKEKAPKEKAPKEKKASKAKKGKKKESAPAHTHALTEEEHSDCEMCVSHGNLANSEADDIEFEEVDLQNKLKGVLSQLGEDEDSLQNDFAGCLDSDEEASLSDAEGDF